MTTRFLRPVRKLVVLCLAVAQPHLVSSFAEETKLTEENAFKKFEKIKQKFAPRIAAETDDGKKRVLEREYQNDAASALKGKLNFTWNQSERDYFSDTARGANAASEPDIKMLDRILGLNTVVFFDILTGVKLQNPYSINYDAASASATLKNNNSQTDGFIEINMASRYIFKTGMYDDTHYANKGNGGTWRYLGQKKGESAHVKWAPEFDLRIGYTYAGKSERPTNLNISTITGGSDFYVDSALGVPLIRYFNDDRTFRFQTGVETGAGFLTDKKFDHVHATAFGGLGVQFAKLRNSPEEPQTGDFYTALRFGYGMFDQPKMNGGKVALDPTVAAPEFSPLYERTWAPTTGVLAMFRISDAFFLQLSGNVYFKNRASWNLSAGISVDPTKFLPTGK
jgi:hypothetical protein